MPTTLKRYKIKLNSLPKIEELLQELYNEVCRNINEIQDQVNRLGNSVQLNDEPMDAKTKYAKAMNDFITNKDKAIGRKLEIAKFMGEIYKFNGDASKALENSKDSMNEVDWERIKEAVMLDEAPKTETYTVKKKK